MASTPARKPTDRRSAASKTTGKTATTPKTAGRSTTPKKRPSSTRTNTLADKKPAAKTNTVHAAKKPAEGSGKRRNPPRDDARQTAKVTRRHTFSEQFMPYILGAVALFLGACLVCDAIGDAGTPTEHLMGVVGYWICWVLFGLVGWPAYLIPALIIHLAIFWKRYCERRLVAIKVTLSVLLTVLLSTFIHVGICTANPAMAELYDPIHLFVAGVELESGGVIGGLIGFVCHLGLRLPGTVVLAVITLPLVLMCLVGVTPGYVFGKLWAAFKAYRERRAEEKLARAEAEIEADEPQPTESYRARRARETEAASEADKPARRTVVVEGETVDEATGEVLDTPPAAPVKERGKARKKAEEPEEEHFATLPIHEPPAPAAAVADTATETTADAPAKAPVPTRYPGMADGDLSWEDSDSVNEVPLTSVTRMTAPAAPAAPPVVPTVPTTPVAEATEADSVALDEEADAPTVEEAPAPTVSFAIVTDGAAPAAADNRQIDVLIHKQDTTAVITEGLGEQEVVIPTVTDIPVTPTREYVFPPMDMLTRGPGRYETNDAEIAENTQKLRDVLESFRIGVKEISCSCGPTITRFEVKPNTGIRVRSIVNLVDDISMGLAKGGVRIEAPIPGKSAVGIEVPNAAPAMVYLRNILETPEFRNHKSRIAACLGADVAGRPVIFDIQAMPHMLIAGATGTGKSVCINSIIMSILYRADPADVKLILIDPKKVEFAMYRDLPHLYAPVVSDPKKAAGALNSAVNEMERRFELIEEVGVRNIAGYNKITEGDPERPPLPQMVIIIDELADLMMTAPAEVETAICRLAQKARAAGIHLVVGTQRPSVDVITGLIKANIPSRIAFAVSSAVDSKIILESTGADKLIGRGDMLFSPIGANKPIRVQGAFVSETEVEQVVTFIKEHNEKGTFNEDFTREIELEAAKCGMGKRRAGEQMSIEECDALGVAKSGEDAKFWDALEVAVGQEKIGTSALQRKLNLGYGRAAKIIDRMEELGFVGPDPGTKQGRKVMITAAELAEYRMNGLPGSRAGDDE